MIKISFLCLFIWILTPLTSSACSCGVQLMSVSQIINYDLVFKGKIIDKFTVDNAIAPNGDTIETIFGLQSYQYVFEIDNLIKGSHDKDTVNIYSITQGSACGVNYKCGDEYYLYAHLDNGTYWTGLCNNNILTHKATKGYKKVIKQFKKSKSMLAWKDISDKMVALGEVSHQEPKGHWIFYHYDGSMETEGLYLNGLKHGDWKLYLNESRSKTYPDKVLQDQIKNIKRPDNILYRIVNYENGIRKEVKNLYELKK